MFVKPVVSLPITSTIKGISMKRTVHITRQRGSFLMELSLGLLILALLGLFAYQSFNSSRESTRIQEEVSDITKYIAATQSLYTAMPDFSGVTTDVLRTNKIFPDSMVSGSTVSNKLAGTVTAAANQLVNPADTVLFTLTNYTEDACKKVIPKIGSGARTISANGTVIKPTDGVLDVPAIGTSCTTSENTVTFVVSK